MPCSCVEGASIWIRDAARALRLLKCDLTAQYLGREAYWDAAYIGGRYHDEYEWILPCDFCLPHLKQALGENHAARVLHVGCGNSRLGRMLHDAGFHDVTNVDYSQNVIDMMARKEPDLKWCRVDCAQPNSLGTAVYDLAIDKGASDSLFEAGSEAMFQQGRQLVREVHRSLRPGGCFLLFSNSAAGFTALNEHFSSVDSQRVEGFSCDLCYKEIFVLVCRK